MQSYIKKIESINGHQSVALVQVVHAPGEDIRDNFGASVSAAVQNDLAVVSGSSSVIQQGRDQTMVRCLLNRTEDVVPLEGAQGMIALSSNMYMDPQERMWTLRASESGDVLVREASANDNDELINMIRSVSSASDVNLRSRMPETAAALAQFEAQLATAQGGDMVSYLSNSGALEVGFIAAQVEEDSGNSYIVVSQSGTEEQITAKSLVAVLDGTQIESTAFPAVDSVSAAVGVDVEKLVDYYKRVYYYRPDYLEKLITIIRGHSF